MQDGLFFRVLRRFNTLVLTLAVLAALTACGYDIWKHGFAWPHIFSQPYDVDTTAVTAPTAPVYGTMPDLDSQNSPEYRATSFFVLTRSNPPAANAPGADGAYGAIDTVNVMVIDDKAVGHWLFKGTHQLIVMRDAVHEGAPQPPPNTTVLPAMTDPRPATGLVMVVFEGVMSSHDLTVGRHSPKVFVWKKGATEAIKLLDIDACISLGQIDADHYRLVYLSGTKMRAALYALPDFKLISDNVLPDAPR